jgi:hypothetical protein
MLLWTEDFFAEPGSDEQFTTNDVEGFIAAQRLALADIINASKNRIQSGDGWGWYREAKGWRADAWGTGKPDPLAKTDKRAVFAWVEDKGAHTGMVRWAIAVPLGNQASQPTTPQPAPAESDDNDTPDDALQTHLADDEHDDATGAAEPAPATEPDAKLPLTKHGHALLAKARTEALRAALRGTDNRYSYDDLLSMLVIALAAGTVRVKTSHHNYAGAHDMRDLAARLLDPQGNLRTDADPGRVAQEALARMLCLPEPDEIGGYNQSGADSARIPLAIGAIVGADTHLPRLDTEAFLATVTGAELKGWAKVEGVKLTKVTDIRERMQGRAQTWRPTWALFAPDEAEGQGA